MLILGISIRLKAQTCIILIYTIPGSLSDQPGKLNYGISRCNKSVGSFITALSTYALDNLLQPFALSYFN